jgi:hypothetical protein
MSDARSSGLKEVNSLISPQSNSSPLNSGKFEGIRHNPKVDCQKSGWKLTIALGSVIRVDISGHGQKRAESSKHASIHTEKWGNIR